MTGHQIREALHSGQRVYATCVTGSSPRMARTLASLGCLDFVFIDSEHVPQSRETLAWMCGMYSGLGLPPVVRIPSPDPFEACKVLDGGASGVIGPYTETVAQAEGLAGAARWRPLKGRRAEGLSDPSSLEDELRHYLEERNRDTILILNIESVPAIENLDKILAVPGVDAVLIGPHDLSCSLGIPEKYDHPRFDEAVRQILSTAREHGVGAGIHFWLDIEQHIQWCRAGANLIMHSSDVHCVLQNFRREFATFRDALGDGGADAPGDVEVV